MGTNNSLSLQESWHLPISSLSLAEQTFESLASETTSPCLPSFLALPLFLPFLPILSLHSPSTRGTTKSKAQLSQQHRSQTPILQNFNIRKVAWCLGTSLRVYGTAFAWSQLQKRERQWQRVYRRRPTALETQEQKTTETETRASLATVYACRFPRWSIPGKIWMPTNQIGAGSASARVSRELRARALGHLGGI